MGTRMWTQSNTISACRHQEAEYVLPQLISRTDRKKRKPTVIVNDPATIKNKLERTKSRLKQRGFQLFSSSTHYVYIIAAKKAIRKENKPKKTIVETLTVVFNVWKHFWLCHLKIYNSSKFNLWQCQRCQANLWNSDKTDKKKEKYWIWQMLLTPTLLCLTSCIC